MQYRLIISIQVTHDTGPRLFMPQRLICTAYDSVCRGGQEYSQRVWKVEYAAQSLRSQQHRYSGVPDPFHFVVFSVFLLLSGAIWSYELPR